MKFIPLRVRKTAEHRHRPLPEYRPDVEEMTLLIKILILKKLSSHDAEQPTLRSFRPSQEADI